MLRTKDKNIDHDYERILVNPPPKPQVIVRRPPYSLERFLSEDNLEEEKPELHTVKRDANGCIYDLEILVNKDRVRKGLKPLKCDKILRAVAKKHTENYFENNIQKVTCDHCWFGDKACKYDGNNPDTWPCMARKPFVT